MDLGQPNFYFYNVRQRFVNEIEGGQDLYEIANNGLSSSYQFIINKKQFQTYAGVDLSNYEYGAQITSSLVMTSSVFLEQIEQNADRPHINALKNTLKYYAKTNPTFNYDNFLTKKLGVLYIPSIFYGSSIKKGSVRVKKANVRNGHLYADGISGDINRNGDLLNITGSMYGTSSVYYGNILYNEGIIIVSEYDYESFEHLIIEYNGVVKQNQILMFATADKNEFNYSNNPTYKNTLYKSPTTSSNKFIEDPKQLIYNINSSSYSTYDESYKKITYISSIGIFDKDKNLIGIAKLSKPVRKRQEDSFTFKLRYDML